MGGPGDSPGPVVDPPIGTAVSPAAKRRRSLTNCKEIPPDGNTKWDDALADGQSIHKPKGQAAIVVPQQKICFLIEVKITGPNNLPAVVQLHRHDPRFQLGSIHQPKRKRAVLVL